MSKTYRQYIELIWENPGVLRAQDIPYSATQSIKEVIDSGSVNVFGTERQDEEHLPTQTTTSNVFQQALRMTTGILGNGKRYRLGWYYEVNCASTSRKVIAQVELDDLIQEQEIQIEPKDVNSFYPISGFAYYTTTNDMTHTIDIDFRCSNNGTTVKIRKARLEIWRVA